MSAFMGPQPLDPELAAAARSVLLVPANGFTVRRGLREGRGRAGLGLGP